VLGDRGDPFQTLARAVVGQQISVKAADTIWSRFAACVGAVAPERVADTEREALLACGLSRRKVEYLVDLAGHFSDGRIDPARWTAMDDEAVIADPTSGRSTTSACRRPLRGITSTASVRRLRRCAKSASGSGPGARSQRGTSGAASIRWSCSTRR